jgi:hypothetical protein
MGTMLARLGWIFLQWALWVIYAAIVQMMTTDGRGSSRALVWRRSAGMVIGEQL